MKRRIVIYENKNGNGEQIFHCENEINKYNNILERDIARMIILMEKDINIKLNPMLVVKYICRNKNRFSPLIEAINYFQHPEDFKINLKECSYEMSKKLKTDSINHDLKILRM